MLDVLLIITTIALFVLVFLGLCAVDRFSVFINRHYRPVHRSRIMREIADIPRKLKRKT